MKSSSSSTSDSIRTFYYALSGILVLLVMGIVGFVLIEDYTLREALYMTVITLSTVGFAEVKPLSSAGQWFTAFLIVSSFGTFAYAFSVLAQSVFSGDLALYLKEKRLDKKISNLKGHTIICGFGRNGRRAYSKLSAYNQPIVVIESNSELIDSQLKGRDILFIQGDATDEEILEYAGLRRARSLISTLGSDADNLFVIITARSMHKGLRLISRSSSESTEKKLRAAGVDAVVLPEAVGGAHMATLAMKPGVVEFLDHIAVEGQSQINLEEISLSDLPDRDKIHSLAELNLRQATGCTVIGIMDENGEYIINPDASRKLSKDTKLFVLGNSQQIKALNAFLKGQGSH